MAVVRIDAASASMGIIQISQPVQHQMKKLKNSKDWKTLMPKLERQIAVTLIKQ